jgi:HK97 family phage prohead protease
METYAVFFVGLVVGLLMACVLRTRVNFSVKVCPFCFQVIDSRSSRCAFCCGDIPAHSPGLPPFTGDNEKGARQSLGSAAPLNGRRADVCTADRISMLSRRMVEAPFITVREDDLENNQLWVVAATETPCDVGAYREVLRCVPEAVDCSRADAVLMGHDPDLIVGRILRVEFELGQLHALLEIDPDARNKAGVSILTALQRNYLQGCSVGYRYDSKDTERSTTEDGRRMVVTVNRWVLTEVSLTPIQSDLAATVMG